MDDLIARIYELIVLSNQADKTEADKDQEAWLAALAEFEADIRNGEYATKHRVHTPTKA